MAGEDKGERCNNPTYPELEVSRSAFAATQRRGPTLKICLENRLQWLIGCHKWQRLKKRFPHFAVNSDLLYQVTEISEEVLDQLLVSQAFRRMVLDSS